MEKAQHNHQEEHLEYSILYYHIYHHIYGLTESLNCDYLEKGDEDVGLGVDQHEDGEEGGETTVEHCRADLSQCSERRARDCKDGDKIRWNQ